jgi:hypothetical protein
MAIRQNSGSTLLRIATAAFLMGTVGCAFPQGATQGDPILGNFHRPIVATPPPERGGLGMDTPAYDGGMRIGVGSPDAPTAVENSNGFMTLPNLTSPNLFSGARLPFTTQGDTVVQRQYGHPGARLPGLGQGPIKAPVLPQAWSAQVSPDSVVARPNNPATQITSGASFDPHVIHQDVKPVKYDSVREPARLFTIEEGHSLLSTMGARNQRLEQTESGDWLFSCNVGYKSYEYRGKEKMETIRSVVEQVQRDR